MIRHDLRDAGCYLLSRFDIQKLIRSVRVRLRAEHAGDQELGLGELGVEHAHEGNRAADAHVHRILAEEALRSRRHRSSQPRRGGRRIPAFSGRIGIECDFRSVRRIAFQCFFDRLRRPLDVDMASATLRANLAPGEGVVTGGYRLPDGSRLFAFVETDSRVDGGIGVASRFFSVPEELVQALGLQTLSTAAANTLQHGEVWVRDELDQVAGALEQSPGARLLSAGNTALQPGRPGEMIFPAAPGDPPLSLNLNAVFDANNNLDLELRVESAPVESSEAPAPASEAAEP